MSSERYLNHPTFGMLYQVSLGIEGKDIYATLYAQKMFFLVEVKQREVFFEVIPYLDARNQSELNLQRARRQGSEDFSKWENLFRQTFL
ncbi:PipX family protein [Prochlorococcus sp. AH-716-G10]|nr:PipX family protein [Prochlorococcus sp. AH-716-G10]